MSNYFRKLPNLDYPSLLKTRESNVDYVQTKNLFRRVKIREDLFANFMQFDKYEIIADEIISVYSDALNKDNSLGGVDNEIKALEFLNQALFNYEIFTVNREKMRINITDKEFDRKSILKDSILNKSRIKNEAEKLLN